jgi:hypothetical protein
MSREMFPGIGHDRSEQAVDRRLKVDRRMKWSR